jgi:hypothetical protein
MVATEVKTFTVWFRTNSTKPWISIKTANGVTRQMDEDEANRVANLMRSLAHQVEIR